MPGALGSAVAVMATLLVGALMGACYFAGLWWTVRRMPSARHPLPLYLGSLVFRSVVVVVTCYAVLIRYGGSSLLFCVAGFIVARVVMIRLLGDAPASELAAREKIG